MEYPTRTDGATHPERDGGPRIMRRRVAGYRVTAALLALLVLVALADTASPGIDVFGVGDGHVRAAGHGFELEVRYPSVTRPAVASPFDVEVTNPDGFDAEIELAINRDFLEIWDVNGLFPEPSEQRSEGDLIIWTFDPPDGDVFRFFYEARIEPARQSGTDGVVQLLDGGDVLLSVGWHTRVLP